MEQILEHLLERHPVLGCCSEDILSAGKMLVNVLENGGKLLMCGNGGSAADCEHFSGEILKSFCTNRPIDPKIAAKLPAELADSLEAGLPAIPLTGFLSASTAFANDVNPQLIFAQLTLALGTEKDMLIGISTSGNAANVGYAMDVARAIGMKTLGLTGEDGGKLAQKAQLAIKVPESETYKIQELHLPVYHALCLMIESSMF